MDLKSAFKRQASKNFEFIFFKLGGAVRIPGADEPRQAGLKRQRPDLRSHECFRDHRPAQRTGEFFIWAITIISLNHGELQ